MKLNAKKIVFIIIFINTLCVAQVLVKNIEPGSASSYPNSFYPFKNKLFFMAYTNFYKWQLYVTDGTSVGTQQLTTILNNSPAYFYNQPTNVNPLQMSTYNGAPFEGCALTDIDSLLFFFCKWISEPLILSQNLPPTSCSISYVFTR